jgi:hypothetical protein
MEVFLFSPAVQILDRLSAYFESSFRTPKKNQIELRH